MEVTLQDVASQLTAISARLDKVDNTVDGMETRLTAHVDKKLLEATDELKQQAAANLKELKQQATENLEELKQQAVENLKELKHQAEMNAEDLQTLVKATAEGYGANLDRIDRELKELNKSVKTTLADHARVLATHSKHIDALEKR